MDEKTEKDIDNAFNEIMVVLDSHGYSCAVAVNALANVLAFILKSTTERTPDFYGNPLKGHALKELQDSVTYEVLKGITEAVLNESH